MRGAVAGPRSGRRWRSSAWPSRALRRSARATRTSSPPARSRKLVAADGGGWTVDVVLTNNTRRELTLSSQPNDLEDSACRPRVPATLAPDRRSEIRVAVPADCKLTRGRFEFEIDAETATDPIVASILFKAAPPPDSESSSGSGAAVPAVLVSLAVLALLGGLVAVVRKRRRSRVTPRT